MKEKSFRGKFSIYPHNVYGFMNHCFTSGVTEQSHHYIQKRQKQQRNAHINNQSSILLQLHFQQLHKKHHKIHQNSCIVKGMKEIVYVLDKGTKFSQLHEKIGRQLLIFDKFLEQSEFNRYFSLATIQHKIRRNQCCIDIFQKASNKIYEKGERKKVQ